MKAAIFEKFGNPTDVLHVADAPLPNLAPGQVLIKTRFSTVHSHNLGIVEGIYGEQPDLPSSEGSEASGTVEKLGEGVTHLQVGQRVAVGQSLTGTWAEYFVADGAMTVPLPDEIDDQTAAQMIAMPMSAAALLDKLGLQRGDWFAYNAANGLVGIFLAHLAKAEGVNMIKIVRRQAAKQELQKSGFDNIVVSSDKDWQKQVQDLTNGAFLKAAVDNIGGQDGVDLFKLLGPKGRLIVFAELSQTPLTIGASDLVFAGKAVEGFWVTPEIMALSEEKLVAYLTKIVTLVASGAVRFPEPDVYTLDDIKRAVETYGLGKNGKVIIRV